MDQSVYNFQCRHERGVFERPPEQSKLYRIGVFKVDRLIACPGRLPIDFLDILPIAFLEAGPVCFFTAGNELKLSLIFGDKPVYE